MACTIDGTTIHLTRGDSSFLHIILTNKGKTFTPAAGDTISFAVKRDIINPQTKEYLDKEPLIYREIPNDTMILELRPSDTKPLSFKENYVYDIQIEFENGNAFTFMSGKFDLLREVH